jgi:hypothetical protein
VLEQGAFSILDFGFWIANCGLRIANYLPVPPARLGRNGQGALTARADFGLNTSITFCEL